MLTDSLGSAAFGICMLCLRSTCFSFLLLEKKKSKLYMKDALVSVLGLFSMENEAKKMFRF